MKTEFDLVRILHISVLLIYSILFTKDRFWLKIFKQKGKLNDSKVSFQYLKPEGELFILLLHPQMKCLPDSASTPAGSLLVLQLWILDMDHHQQLIDCSLAESIQQKKKKNQRQLFIRLWDILLTDTLVGENPAVHAVLQVGTSTWSLRGIKILVQNINQLFLNHETGWVAVDLNPALIYTYLIGNFSSSVWLSVRIFYKQRRRIDVLYGSIWTYVAKQHFKL